MTLERQGLPPLPPGKATVMGGEIRDVDSVRDRFTLLVPGGKPVKLLFDARTQLYRDGVKIAPGELHSGDRASVETVLDGTTLFAVSIHMLSRAPVGECQGQVVAYDAGTHELTMSNTLTRERIRLLVPPGTPFVRQEEAASSSPSPQVADLVPGTLLTVKFVSDHRGKGVATQIAIQATPGAHFVFSGDISSLDLHTGSLVLVDASKDKTYQLYFDPQQLPATRDLHPGDHVRVTASFDRTRYVAEAISVGD